MIDRTHSILVVIDVQERMMPAIHGSQSVTDHVAQLVGGCCILEVPDARHRAVPGGARRNAAGGAVGNG